MVSGHEEAPKVAQASQPARGKRRNRIAQPSRDTPAKRLDLQGRLESLRYFRLAAKRYNSTCKNPTNPALDTPKGVRHF
jgi:hypothetical protein